MSVQPAPILQPALDYAPWRIPNGGRLPGTGPCAPADWLMQDAAHADQMALRDRLVEQEAARVFHAEPGASAALRELLDHVLDWLAARPDARVGADDVIRADGVTVPVDRARPLVTLGRLVQEDFCLLQPGEGGEHVLTAAVLCFPASWSLGEKAGRPLTGIHAPVASYDDLAARRVQRLFDALRPGAVLMRANCLAYRDFALFAPRTEGDRRPHAAGDAPYVRLERQTLRRLPDSGAVVFAIHTAMLRRAALDPADAAALGAYLGRDTG